MKLMENIVAEEILGLGEPLPQVDIKSKRPMARLPRCLSICAQRSRTLKLLSFQHLHFDARLQDRQPKGLRDESGSMISIHIICHKSII